MFGAVGFESELVNTIGKAGRAFMGYRVHEIFYSLQGEGVQTGCPAVFCRFSGCNLWSGGEEGRKEALCSFCDTDFVGIEGLGGEEFANPQELAVALEKAWTGTGIAKKLVVLTGGEPLLQVDSALVEALHRADFTVALETNGTLPAPSGIDWICVSPKARAPLKQLSGNELKVVFPQEGLNPADLEDLLFDHLLIQPCQVEDPEENRKNLEKSIAFVKAHPRWRLSVQIHKILQIP